MASKQPRRSNLKSDLKFMAQTTYATMFILAVLTSFWNLTERRKKEERKKKEEHLAPLDLSASPQVKTVPSFGLRTWGHMGRPPKAPSFGHCRVYEFERLHFILMVVEISIQ